MKTFFCLQIRGKNIKHDRQTGLSSFQVHSLPEILGPKTRSNNMHKLEPMNKTGDSAWYPESSKPCDVRFMYFKAELSCCCKMGICTAWCAQLWPEWSSHTCHETMFHISRSRSRTHLMHSIPHTPHIKYPRSPPLPLLLGLPPPPSVE